MHPKKILESIGIIEILIGGVTLLGTGLSWIFLGNTKPLNVTIFVVITGCLSSLLGAGILNYRKVSCDLLIYFSSVIVISKMLIWAGIIHLNGAFETLIPAWSKNLVSVGYHGFLIFYLQQKSIRKLFVN